MSTSDRKTMRVAFQGEPGPFSEAAAIQLLGGAITTVPRATFEAAFTAIAEGAADALLAPVENSLAGSVVRVYDLLLESNLGIVAETILPIEHHLIGCPGASLDDIRSVASHPMALAQCEKFFLAHEHLKRVPAEDNPKTFTRFVLLIPVCRGAPTKSAAPPIASPPAVADLMIELKVRRMEQFTSGTFLKMSIALRLAHNPGALLAALEPFARHGIN